MLASFIIVFREVLEAALIVGTLLAATKGILGRRRWVLSGIIAGIAGAALVAVFTEALSNAVQGMGQEIFNACILLLAALLIGWHVIWMKSHSKKLAGELKDLGGAVSEGRSPLYALAVISALAVLREGAEIVLFIYGLLVSGQAGSGLFIGSLSGLGLGLLFGFLIYLGLVKIPASQVFSVTAWVLTLLAAGMVSHAAGYLTAVGVLPTLIDSLWNASAILPEKSILGNVLHALVGYMEKPTGIQGVVYLLTVGGIVVLSKLFGKKKIELAIVLCILTGIAGLDSNAYAARKVYSPYVQPGELEVEYRGSTTFDDRPLLDDKEKHQLAVGYGVTERWFFEVYGSWENHLGSSDEDLAYEATEIENRFQLTEQGEAFADFGFQVENEFAPEREGQDGLKLMPLIQKDFGQWSHRVNPFVEYAYGGEDEEDEWEAGVNWSSFYRAQTWFEPGLEIYWNYGNVEESQSFDEQLFLIGPVVYGKIGDHVKYDVGYLFGVSESSADGELKWIIEFEWHF